MQNMYKLVISEKPSVGKSLAAVLGANERRDGYFMGSGYIVSWCFGHLAELAEAAAYDEKYAKWRYNDLPILPEIWQYSVARDKAKQLALLNTLMHREDVSEVVNACDAGREGESIFRTVYLLNKCDKPMKRLWISSMEDTAIRKGFETLKDGSAYDNLYASALCRSKADWLVGINATRLFSVLYHRTLNVGRVVSPTLALIVQRESEIDAFKPQPFYTVTLGLPGFDAGSERMKSKADAETLSQSCVNQTAVVTKLERKDKSEKPPALYDLTTLQRDANRILGFTAQQTLDYLQSLYEKKLCTYPRTDSRYLTSDMADGLPALVSNVAAAMPKVEGVPIRVNATQVINDKKVSDHHAVIPTANLNENALAGLPAGERAVLELVALRLLCAVAQSYEYTETAVTLECAGHSFSAKGRTVMNPGWRALMEAHYSGKGENETSDAAKARACLRTGRFPRAPIWRLCRNKGLHPLRRLRGYPCTPTKTVHPPWRLYYFCGFYYPIREVIPIAIYHWNIGIVSRGKGKSAVAAAAYRSGEKLTNEWDGMTHDYTRKGGVVHTEIMLPPHAPPSFSDRSTLWNSVELYEKAGNAQLAREIDAALPIELSREEQIRLVREYCSSQFVSRGMCVDYAIHDTDSGNPHCHIMLTMRPLNERGAWAAKSKKEYDLDENGERIRLPSGRYKTHKVDLTGWNDKDNTLLWRKASP